MKIVVLSAQAFSVLKFRSDMISSFVRAGHEVIVGAPDTEEHWYRDIERLGAEYQRIRVNRTSINPIQDLSTLVSIMALLRREKPDLVFSYQAKTVIYGMIAAGICGVPKRYALIAGLGSAFRNTGHSMKAKALKAVLSLEYRIALRFAKKVFFQNQDDAAEFVGRRIVKKTQIEYMNGSGVNLDVFKQTAIPDENRFLIISRYIRDKGIIEYLEAARIVKQKYPEASFEMVGYYDPNPSALKPDELQPYFDQDIALNCGKQDDVTPYLNRCSVYVLPSYHEGTPKSVLEAMAVGRPIITTNAPGCRETVQDGVNGFLVEVKDVESLAEKMIWLIEHPTEAKNMGRRSREMVESRFDVRIVNKKLMDSMKLNK